LEIKEAETLIKAHTASQPKNNVLQNTKQ